MSSMSTLETRGLVPRARRFLRKPWSEKTKTLKSRWAGFRAQLKQSLRDIHVPVRLGFGAWWIPRKDNLGEPLLAGRFETAELAFTKRFLQPGMTVLDLGAHHGLYTLLGSKCVGRHGHVIAFEPSRRERRALRLHLLLNMCRNVAVQSSALANHEGVENLYVVEDFAAGCNSLKPPAVKEEISSKIRVRVVRLDDWLESQKIDHVDFIKLDVEGAELDVLKGGARLLQRRPRPVILAEVQDLRTQPWGYAAREIIQFLSSRQYKWFSLSDDGSLQDTDVSSSVFDGNFVACPEESLGLLQELGR